MTSAQELSCIFCKESFGDKESLQTHFRKHGDPKFNQATKAKLRVQSNSPTSSDTSRDDVEMVSCDVCNEVFPTISKAITHKHKIHPDYDAKYFCPWCGKLFTLKFLYNKHLESSHESMPKVTNCFHCDCCDVDFFLPCAMVYHNKFYHRQEKDATSIGFSKKVKFLCQELVQIYYCPFCGEEYENKVNLNKHMEDEHSDENQCPEDILRCPLCEAVFYHLDAYELHLTFHSSEDLYSEENEMLKQIVEFSLDTVPPLMEKLEIPPTPEDNDAMGVDQFLQLSMCKESDEQPDHTEKVKSKKHKKHKKSKKTITLDEFLNMNTDLFGEGLNIQGIEEVPTRVVTKQLKPKKEPVLKNLKNKPLPTNIDKLQKQGITIKMKSGNKIVPNEIKQPISTPPISTLKNSNVISTSSEVLSRLMNQSNNQIKIVKKAAASNTNVDYDIKESNNTITSKNEEMHDVADNEEFSEATENMSANNNTEASTSETDKDKNEEENKPENDNETIQDKDKVNKSPLSTETASNPLKEKASNVTSDNNYEINDTNCTSRSDDNIKNQETVAENPSSITNTNDNINFEERETLDDFEESLIANKIPRTENTTKESQNNGEISPKSMSEKNETIIDQQEKANNTLNAIKHLSHLITVKSVQSKPSPKGEDGETNNKSSHDQIEDLNDEINYEDEDDEDNIPISKLENKKDKPKDLNPLKNLSKNVTVKSLTSQMTTSKLDQFNHDSDDLDSTDQLSNLDSANKSITNNIVGRKVVNLGNRSRTETIIKNSQTESPTQGTSKKLKVRKTVENNSQPNSPNENTRLNTSNADLLKRLTNVTAKPISSKLSIKPTAQTVEQSATVKKEHFTERVKKQGKINEEIEIFNIDDSDSDDQNKLYENEP
ncbi:Zinc finger and BTB domain-containing protein 40 [Papilio xuthus]|uniref:Zinc finger and BTB domain-containing protein 40 n=1 Tax=Papilio xuthus TaxID=66420 RepID=A0A194PS94_PAPXU|nr:Zinc finger and BTB domain-containing protein 40 [Papilio xuthus]